MAEPLFGLGWCLDPGGGPKNSWAGVGRVAREPVRLAQPDGTDVLKGALAESRARHSGIAAVARAAGGACRPLALLGLAVVPAFALMGWGAGGNPCEVI